MTSYVTNTNKLLNEIAKEKENGKVANRSVERGKADDDRNAERLATLAVQFERLQDRFDGNDEVRINLEKEPLKKDIYIELLSNKLSRLNQLLNPK